MNTIRIKQHIVHVKCIKLTGIWDHGTTLPHVCQWSNQRRPRWRCLYTLSPEGRPFHTVTARYARLPRANSVRTRHGCSWPSAVARVQRVRYVRAADQSLTQQLSGTGAGNQMANGGDVTLQDQLACILHQPSSRSAGVTCSRHAALDQWQCAHQSLLPFADGASGLKYIHPSHAVRQYRRCGKTSASTGSRLVHFRVSYAAVWPGLRVYSNSAARSGKCGYPTSDESR